MFRFKQSQMKRLFECPITQEEIEDPVLLVGDGHTYERQAITTWLEKGNRLSPMTREHLEEDHLHIVPNHKVRSLRYDFEVIYQAFFEMQSTFEVLHAFNEICGVLKSRYQFLDRLLNQYLMKRNEWCEKKQDVVLLQKELEGVEKVLMDQDFELYKQRKAKLDLLRKDLRSQIEDLSAESAMHQEKGQCQEAARMKWQKQIAEEKLRSVDKQFIDLKIIHHRDPAWARKKRQQKMLVYRDISIKKLEEEMHKMEQIYEESYRDFLQKQIEYDQLAVQLKQKGLEHLIVPVQRALPSLNEMKVCEVKKDLSSEVRHIKKSFF